MIQAYFGTKKVAVIDVNGNEKTAVIQSLDGPFLDWTHGGWVEKRTITARVDLLRFERRPTATDTQALADWRAELREQQSLRHGG